MTVVFTTSALAGTDDGNGDGNGNQGCVFLANTLTAAASANQCRVTFLFGHVCPTSVGAIDGLWVGRGAGSGSLNYNGNQCQLFKVGGGSTFDGGNDVSFTTDWSTFGSGETFDNTKDLVVRFHFLNGTSASVAFNTVSNVNFGFDAGGADNSGATTAGYSASLSNTDVAITKIEMQVSGGGAVASTSTFLLMGV